MKKVMLVCCLLSAQLGFGQMQKGALLAGGSFNFNSSNTDYKQQSSTLIKDISKASNFNANLRVGRFVTDCIAIGVVGGYGYSSSKREQESTYPSTTNSSSKGSNYSFGFFGRGYKMFNENKFGFFGDLSAIYQLGNSKTIDKTTNANASSESESKSTSAGYSAAFRPGVLFFITPKIAIEGSLGALWFTRTKEENSRDGQKMGENINTNFNLNFNVSTAFLGVSFYFGK